MKKISQDIINRVKRQSTMEKAIEFLRTLEYFFVDGETFKKSVYPKLTKHEWEPGPWDEQKLSFMVRSNQNKNIPVFGIKLLGRKRNELTWVVYGKGGDEETIRIPWERKKIVNFKKMTIHWTFPNYITHKQRREWRAEWRRLQKNPDLKPSEFYLKVLPDVVFLKPFK